MYKCIYTHIPIGRHICVCVYTYILTHINQSVLIEKSFSHLNVCNSNIMKSMKHRDDADNIFKMVILYCKVKILNTRA